MITWIYEGALSRVLGSSAPLLTFNTNARMQLQDILNAS